jgi:hypothetical protein
MHFGTMVRPSERAYLVCRIGMPSFSAIGLLHHESMFLGELSDMVGIEYQRSQDCNHFFSLVMQIATGKCISVVACCCFLLS